MPRSSRATIAVFVGVIALVVPIGVNAAPASAAPSTHGQSAANTFAPASPMSVRRIGATATLLGTGDVLVAGGGTASAELYHPATDSWTTTTAMSSVRTDATATLLENGDVLVAGGCCEAGHPDTGLTSAEIYDPSTGTWSPTGSLKVGRAGATATLLQNGDVLVAGGSCNGEGYGCDAGSFLSNLKSAEIYDPSTGVWTLTGSMNAGRAVPDRHPAGQRGGVGDRRIQQLRRRLLHRSEERRTLRPGDRKVAAHRPDERPPRAADGHAAHRR